MRMPPKCATSSRKRSASSSLSPAPVPRDVAASGGDTLKKPRLSKTKANDHSHPIEEYQQVTKADFVETYKVDELEGGDCYYMPGVGRISGTQAADNDTRAAADDHQGGVAKVVQCADRLQGLLVPSRLAMHIAC